MQQNEEEPAEPIAEAGVGSVVRGGQWERRLGPAGESWVSGHGPSFLFIDRRWSVATVPFGLRALIFCKF